VSGEAGFVFALIAVAGGLMASNRVRFDIVALLVVLALMLSGILSTGEALAGFGSSVVILVAALLVIGEMLDRTGVARAVGDWILKKGGSNETYLLILIMAGAGILGSVMSSTAVVAIFIPIVLRIAAETKLNSSRMLMPMSLPQRSGWCCPTRHPQCWWRPLPFTPPRHSVSHPTRSR
jgi:di/tricarboxylate transporter